MTDTLTCCSAEQGTMIRRYIVWRNKHTADIRLRAIANRVNVA